nr:immunity 8 family protein [Devosia sp. MC1541]
MIATVKSIDLIDHENWAYWPDDVEDFCVAAEAMIGPDGEDGADIFSFEVCTPKWFYKNRLNSAAFARHVVFVSAYDEKAVQNLVVDTVANITGGTWSEIAEKLSRHFRWEYEDYRS